MEGIEANSNLRLNLVVVFLVSTFPAPLHSLMCMLNPLSCYRTLSVSPNSALTPMIHERLRQKGHTLLLIVVLTT